MLYVLKFGASFVLPPGIFIVVLAAAALRLRQRSAGISRLLMWLTLLLYLMSIHLVSDALGRSWENRIAPPDKLEGDVIVMLGGGATMDTPDMSGLGNLADGAANRFLTAVRLQKRLAVPIIFSGGRIYTDSGCEAEIAGRLAGELGIPVQQIIMDKDSLNTRQNALLVKKLMQEQGFVKPILVTSAVHMPRAVLNFSKLGIEVVPCPAGYSTSRRSEFHYNKLAPSFEAFYDTGTVLREMLGITAAKLIK